ncbi:Thioesterase/thiol ester dehydrase-isomerase [Hyaloscypha hepaticicola]|uniref:Thioesterase/thiol ester dehydrase-isomerase n=1 Tax=Hyaloscypha hepaticicola TaxID=2082293 RepID=A0A2J6QG25_9HELO|nr:Thioesterase/thiol ester dehydrase-isomerase [Hyaloscypha hepaticicola]
MSSPELDHVRGVWQRMQGNSPIYDFLLSDVEIISARKGAVTARLALAKNHVNSRGTIHGAVSAALADWSGASIDIHVTYIGTANVGETIEIEAIANKVGRSIAFTTLRIYKLVEGQQGPMIATASHTKYISQQKKE